MKSFFLSLLLLLSCTHAFARCESEVLDLVQVYEHSHHEVHLHGTVFYTDLRDPYVIFLRTYIDPNPNEVRFYIRKQYVLQFFFDHDVECYLFIRYKADGIFADGFETDSDAES